jgi:hypothetical protein
VKVKVNRDTQRVPASVRGTFSVWGPLCSYLNGELYENLYERLCNKVLSPHGLGRRVYCSGGTYVGDWVRGPYAPNQFGVPELADSDTCPRPTAGRRQENRLA